MIGKIINQHLFLIYKKQASACEHFKYEMLRLVKLNPDDADLVDWLWWSWSSRASSLPLSSLSWTSSLFKRYPSLKMKFDEIIEAKKKYEDNGGDYK